MKKPTIKFLTILSVFLFLTSATFTDENEKVHVATTSATKSLSNPRGENTIIDFENLSDPLNKYSYNLDDLNEGLLLFKNNFKYWENRSQSQPVYFQEYKATLKLKQLNFLSDLCSKVDTEFSLANCVAALRMHYAIENGTMIILFEPIYLRYNGDKFIIVKKDVPTFYRDVEDTMINVLNNVSLIEAYTSTDSSKSKIHINHLAQAQAGNTFFINDDENAYVGDIKSCILPVQQIERVYFENAHDNKDSLINFSIVASNYFKFPPTKRPRGTKNLKLHVVAYLNDIGSNNSVDSFLHLGADFGQMNPPNQTSIIYKTF